MVCPYPFTTLYLQIGSYPTCCPAWIDRAAIVQGYHGPWGTWNHSIIRALRREVLEGTYGPCAHCPGRLAPGENDEPLAEWKPAMDGGPARINVANDRSCNLHCWSCRRELFNRPADPKQAAILRAFAGAFLPTADMLSVSHSGDPFASQLHREFLQSLDGRLYPALRIELFTNGLLLLQHWPSIERIHGNIKAVLVSVDAAARDTYERLRRGASWEQLRKALKFVAGLRRTDQLDELQLNFCVQSENFREMPAFVELAFDHEATHVVFNMLRPWWHSPQQYREQSLADDSHPDAAEFTRMLEHRLLKHPRVVAPMVSSEGRDLIRRMHHAV